MKSSVTNIFSSYETEKNRSIEANYLIKDKTYKIFFQSEDITFSERFEAFLASLILPCMKANEKNLVIEEEVSQTFITSLSTIQDIYSIWDSSLHRIKIENLIPVVRKPPLENRVGTFFSGGVDSFYTFLKHQEEITDLIFVHGLDIKLNDTLLREKASKKIREVASSFGKNVIEIETNIRKLLDPYVPWGELGHGVALATIGHLLSQNFSRIFIPASHTYADLFPWGSHPILDHLWSSETLEFAHDGCEATRVNKVSLISKYDIALQTLRVCWSNPNGAYNCGRCEKCLRTMINLEVNGALNRCTTFEHKLDPKQVSKILVKDENTRSFIRENLKALEDSQGDERLRKVLEKILNDPPWLVEMKIHVKNFLQKILKSLDISKN